MGGFGGFCPLPLRLGGPGESGWSPEQHARVCADLVAATNAAALTVIRYTTTGGVLVVQSVRTMQGAGLAYVPQLSIYSTAAVSIVLTAPPDAYDQAAPMFGYHCAASALWDGGTPSFASVVRQGSAGASSFIVRRLSLNASPATVDGPVSVALW